MSRTARTDVRRWSREIAPIGGGSPRLSTVKIVIYSFLPVVVLIALAEFSLRVYAHYFQTVYEVYSPEKDRLVLVPNFNKTLPNGRKIRINSKGFVGQEFKADKDAGTIRIFTLGDSCTFGGNWDKTYSIFLQDQLNAEGGRFEVINAGIEGYNSEYALGRLKDDILQYSPDLVTIYIGWNDLMKHRPESGEKGGRMLPIGSVLSHSYLYKGLSKLIFFYIRPALSSPSITGQDADHHVFDEYRPLIYEQNVTEMVRLLLENNVKVLLLTRPTVITRMMTAEDLQKSNVFFPYFPEAYGVPQLLSLHEAYNNVLRRLAETNAVPLIDLDDLFNQYDKRTFFWDTMHPSEEGHMLIAKALSSSIKQVLGK